MVLSINLKLILFRFVAEATWYIASYIYIFNLMILIGLALVNYNNTLLNFYYLRHFRLKSENFHWLYKEFTQAVIKYLEIIHFQWELMIFMDNNRYWCWWVTYSTTQQSWEMLTFMQMSSKVMRQLPIGGKIF